MVEEDGVCDHKREYGEMVVKEDWMPDLKRQDNMCGFNACLKSRFQQFDTYYTQSNHPVSYTHLRAHET